MDEGKKERKEIREEKTSKLKFVIACRTVLSEVNTTHHLLRRLPSAHLTETALFVTSSRGNGSVSPRYEVCTCLG